MKHNRAVSYSNLASCYSTILESLKTSGWARVSKVYNPKLMVQIKEQALKSETVFQAIQKRNGVGDEAQNSTHHSLLTCPKMFDLISPNPLHGFLKHYFQGKYILNTMGASFVRPKKNYVYTQKIHRDIRSFSGEGRLLINTLVMLDDSTEENGATWMLSGSHKTSEQPGEAYFYSKAERALGERGDLLIFDANIWHAAGVNTSSETRAIVTPIYTPPYIKQALDYPRALGLDFQHGLTDELKQVLGYRAMVPQTLDEFYKPRERRFYQPDQG